MPEPSLNVAIASAPNANVSLENDLKLLKPALLYADHVTLYSPTTVLLASLQSLAGSDEEARLEFLNEVAPALKNAGDVTELLNGLAFYERLRSKKGRSKEEMTLVWRFREKIDEAWASLKVVAERMLQEAGGEELSVAIDSGLLTVDSLLDDEPEDYWEELMSSFVDKLGDVLSGPTTAYPLFDDETGELVRTGVAEGLFKPSELTEQRAKEIGAASEIMSFLPAFPMASISEILDIRDELRSPLVRFRAAMIEMSRVIDNSSYAEEFQAEVTRLYEQEIAPALLEIQEAVRDSTYVRQLVNAVVDDFKSVLIEGVMALGAATYLNVPDLAAAGAAIAGPPLRAAWNKKQNADEISRHKAYFLYRAQGLLS